MKAARFALLSLALAGSFVFACGATPGARDGFEPDASSGDNPATGSSGSGNGGSSGTGIDEADAATPPSTERCQKMDILFVIDDSVSMADEQAKLADNFPAFAETINSFTTESGAQLDWRVAVTTTGKDVRVVSQTPLGNFTINEEGDNGAFRESNCGGADRRWIERADDSAVSDFQCRARVGDDGSSTEMPLETARLALTDRLADTNTGFLREDALLAIVIVTDEDDSSTTADNLTVPLTGGAGDPITNYVSAFNTIARGANRWATAVIAAPEPCGEKSAAADRLRDFVDAAGPRGKFSSICVNDLTPALLEALSTFDAACNEFPPPVVN